MSRPRALKSCSVATVDRGLQVLRAFRSEAMPLTNAELVRRTGLSKATVSRFTTTLLHVGCLRLGADGRNFELAARPLVIGHAFAHGNELLAAADSVLQALAEKMGASATLSVADGPDMLCLAFRAVPGMESLRFGIGSLLPMATTAVGHAHLFGWPAEDRLKQIGLLKDSMAPQRWHTADQAIRSSFDQLEERGSCIVRGAFAPGIYAVAQPLPIGRDGFIAVLSCGGLGSDALDLDTEHRRIAPALGDAVARLRTALADHDGRP